MNRRESLKAIGIGTLSGVLLDACKTKSAEEKAKAPGMEGEADRLATEVERDSKLSADTFFTPHEMATITVLADMIIPKDDRSGSASEAGVPNFIDFMAKDKPELQTPLRGGLRWLDRQCLTRYNSGFVDCSKPQQAEIVDAIAYPEKAKQEMKQGVAFFNRMRDLTATGFFTSKPGMEDLGYIGNRPNKWEGVPKEIVKQYGLENVRFASSENHIPYKID
jgi:gluconate 2-dehydrogenase gamma chain